MFNLRSKEPIQNNRGPKQEIKNPYKKKLEKYKSNEDGTYTGEFAQNINPKRNKKQARRETENIMELAARGENAIAYAEGDKGGLFSSTKSQGGSGTASLYSWSNNPDAVVDKKEVKKALGKSGGIEVKDGIVTPKSTRTESQTINSKQYGMLEAKANQFQKRIDEKNAAKIALSAKKQKLKTKNK
jgi:hypothetical protein